MQTYRDSFAVGEAVYLAEISYADIACDPAMAGCWSSMASDPVVAGC